MAAGSGSRPELLYLPLKDLPEPTVSLEMTTKVVVSCDLRSQEPRKRPKRQTALVETTKVEPASGVDLLAESQEKPMQPHQTPVSPEPALLRKMPQQTTKKEGDGRRRPAGAQASTTTQPAASSSGTGFGFRNTNAGASRGGPRGGGGDGGSRGRGRKIV